MHQTVRERGCGAKRSPSLEVPLPVLHGLSVLRHHSLDLDGDLDRRWRYLRDPRVRHLHAAGRPTHGKVDVPDRSAEVQLDVHVIDDFASGRLDPDRLAVHEEVPHDDPGQHVRVLIRPGVVPDASQGLDETGWTRSRGILGCPCRGSQRQVPRVVRPARYSRLAMPPKPARNPREQLREGPTTHRVILSDSRQMPEVADQSIHLVTSPPYAKLKTYAPGNPSQLGDIDDYDKFLDELDKVWVECARVLMPGGRVCCVVGDVNVARSNGGRHHVRPLASDIRVRARRLGLDHLQGILWYKVANIKLEASRSTRYLGKPNLPGGIVKNDIEHILFLRKPGYRSPSAAMEEASFIPVEDYVRWFRSIWDDIPEPLSRITRRRIRSSSRTALSGCSRSLGTQFWIPSPERARPLWRLCTRAARRSAMKSSGGTWISSRPASPRPMCCAMPYSTSRSVTPTIGVASAGRLDRDRWIHLRSGRQTDDAQQPERRRRGGRGWPHDREGLAETAVGTSPGRHKRREGANYRLSTARTAIAVRWPGAGSRGFPFVDAQGW